MQRGMGYASTAFTLDICSQITDQIKLERATHMDFFQDNYRNLWMDEAARYSVSQ